MSLLWLTLISFLLAPAVDGQRYNVHMFDEHPFVHNLDNGKRYLQQLGQGGGLGTDICSIRGGDAFGCSDTVRITADDGSYSDLDINFECPLEELTGFDYRRPELQGFCTCSAIVRPSNTTRPIKECPCSICPEGFGSSPIAIDCNAFDDEGDEDGVDPFIIETCSSLDCGFACNGTCNFNCDVSGPECPFCEGNTFFQPTMAPTGPGGNPDDPFANRPSAQSTNGDGSSSAVRTYFQSTLILVGVAVFTKLFLS